MKNIYFIGGSPCSGKSTIAEIIAKKYGMKYVKADNYIDDYIELGSKRNLPICKKQKTMNGEQIWMREPMLQCEEEFLFYKETNDFLWRDLNRVDDSKGIITEGAAYVPQLMKKAGVAAERYIAIVPEKEFQLSHYQQRTWVPYVLKDCSDKEKAFDNWMERDSLFAREVKKQAEIEGYEVIENDGGASIEELVNKVELHFGFKKQAE